MAIKIKLPPFSLNSAYYKNRNYTTKARNYRESFLLQLQLESNLKYMKDVNSRFGKKNHSLSLKITFFHPRSIMFTKQGYVSRKSQDLDNCLKLPIDFLCGSKYMGRVINGTEIVNLGIDDQFITSIHALKKVSPTDEHLILIEFDLLPL